MQKAVAYLSKKDSIFKQIIQQYGIPEIPKRKQGFETLALLILEQQVSIDLTTTKHIIWLIIKNS